MGAIAGVERAGIGHSEQGVAGEQDSEI